MHLEKNFENNKLIYFFLFIILIIIFYGIIKIIFEHLGVKLETQITYGDLLNSIIAILITIYIPWVLNKGVNRRANTKNHIINELINIENLIIDIENIIENSIHKNSTDINIDIAKIIIQTKLKYISLKILSLEDYKDKYSIDINNLVSYNFYYRGILTERFGNKDFILDINYYRLTSLECEKFVQKIIKCKKDFIYNNVL